MTTKDHLRDWEKLAAGWRKSQQHACASIERLGSTPERLEDLAMCNEMLEEAEAAVVLFQEELKAGR